jgi:hypothetical protein
MGIGLTSDPPLGRTEMRRMDDKLVCPLIKRRRRFQSRDVGPMSQFCKERERGDRQWTDLVSYGLRQNGNVWEVTYRSSRSTQ